MHLYRGQRAIARIVGGITLLLLCRPVTSAPETAGTARPAAHEVWVAIRADGRPGTGTQADPFDGGSVEKLNALFERFLNEYGDNLTVRFGPGVYEGDRIWGVRNHWKIRGAGMDITTFRTRADPQATGAVGFREGGYTGGPVGFELSDATFDFNVLNLRRPNRAFVYPRGRGYEVAYVHVGTPAEWSAEKAYRRGSVVLSEGAGYIGLKESRGEKPAAGEFWTVLRPNDPAALPAWDAGREYVVGEAVAKEGKGYLCVSAGKGSDPAGVGGNWKAMDPDAPDPDILTHAAFVHARPPGGGHRVSRVKALNGNGSWFFGREGFLIGLGGNDCVIEDCVVEQFRGDYATLIVTTFGQNGVVRGCTVRGNDGLCTMAYGGWACWDTVFEGNFSSNVRCATNIDSLNCRNVTFRNNVFMDCREVGILVNVGGRLIEDHRRYSMEIDGKPVEDFARSCMDGLFITGNVVQMRDGAPYGAIQAQVEGLRNVWIRGNVLRTASGQGRARAIGVLRAENVSVSDNLCEPGMYCEAIPLAAHWQRNFDILGRPMVDATGKPVVERAPTQ